MPSPALADPLLLTLAAVIMAIAGFIKGATGFALPVLVVSAYASLMTPAEAVALLILPAFFANIWQMLRQGAAAAWATARRFWKITAIMAVLIGLGAQFVPHLRAQTLMLVVGAVIALTGAVQLAGWRPRPPRTPRGAAQWEVGAALAGGISGGLTGVWGPPVIFFLMAIGTDKTTQVRAQGVVFFVGSVVLLGAHTVSGVLNATTLPLSVLMVPPVLAGMALGVRVQDRLDPKVFTRITLILVLLAGLNLVRRGLG